jgi:hypothetical protein
MIEETKKKKELEKKIKVFMNKFMMAKISRILNINAKYNLPTFDLQHQEVPY